MTEIEAKGRAFELAEDHWDYIESLLYAHNIPIKELDIARFHYKEAFKHGYKHCWEDQLARFEFPTDQLMDTWSDYELSSNPNPQGNQAS
jgi:hypothetical protein